MSAIGNERLADGTAWQGLEELRDGLRAFLSRHCPDENDVDDVIQETFVRAARYRSGCQGVQRLRPWTMRIALNVLSDWKRRGQRMPVFSLEDEGLEPPAPAPGEPEPRAFQLGRFHLDGETASALVSGTRDTLRPADRALLESFYGGAGSARVSAQECGIPRHLVKVRLFRVRQRLLRALRRRITLEERWSVAAS
jgi:RNA polymerase sigma factor (sigma-70 family)